MLTSSKKCNKLETLLLSLLFCLAGVGQALGEGCENAVFWKDCTLEPGTQTIGGKAYYSITKAEELAWFAAKVNTTQKNNPNVSSGVNAILMNDIDLSDYLWVPIAAGKGDGIFSGVFDGNSHIITGLRIDGHRIAYETENIYCRDHENKPLCNGQNIGFFGSSKGTIKNLSLEIADIQASNSEGLTMQMGKPISVGTLVGWMNGGTIDGVYISGHINTSGNGQGVGGIVGNAASGTIQNSVSDVSIYASGNNVFIGGVAGYTKGAVNINSCMYTGENIVNDGQNGAVGGIVGNSTSNSLNATSSYYDTDIFGNNGVGTGSVKTENKPTGVAELNSERVACGMNGGTWDANAQSCSNQQREEWEVGISELSQNGSDGYKITFVVNAENAVFPNNAVTSKVVAKNASITADGISLPTREGFKFAGWAETSNAEGPSTNLGTATGRRTIYAVWYGKFPVTFSAGSGSFPNGNPEPLMVAKGDLISLDIEVPVKASIGEDHFYFAGWTTGSEIVFEKNQERTGIVNFDEFTVSATTLFYPAWTKDVVHTVKFNANGHGQTKLEQIDVSDGFELNAPENPAPDVGYQYDAWCLVADCQNVEDEFVFPHTIESSFELYAKWSAVSYPINYNLDGGSVPNPGNPSAYTIEDQFELLAPSKECFDFVEWYDLDNNHVVGITEGSTGEKTFSARWKQQTKFINYSTGNIIQATATTQEFLCGESITLSDTLNAFSRSGYTQDGWTTTVGGNNVLDPKSSYVGTANVTLYAHWSPITYSINYELDGGAFATSAVSTYTVDDAITLPEPTKANYEFAGWYDNANFEGDAITEIEAASTGDTTFYAKWNKAYPFLVNDFGAIKVYEDENGKLTAEIDGMSTGEVSTISPEDNILVSSVNFNREFPVNETAADKMYSTIVLPFSIDTNKVPAAEFYELKSVDVENAQIEFWAAEKTLQANTPYIIRTKAATLSFNLDEGETVALNTSELNNSNSEDGLWEFRGTYSYIKWKDHADELGRAYGFRAQAENSYAIGSFARIGSSATTRPFRAYLLKKNSQHANRLAFPLKKSSTSLDRASIDEDSVPGTLDVVIVERETGETTAIGTLDTRTGEIKFIDSWFDMKGRRLNAKPTTKGIYYYNGKRVIVR